MTARLFALALLVAVAGGLVAVLADPFTERSVGERYALASPPDYDGAYTTFCGT